MTNEELEKIIPWLAAEAICEAFACGIDREPAHRVLASALAHLGYLEIGDPVDDDELELDYGYAVNPLAGPRLDLVNEAIERFGGHGEEAEPCVP